MTIKSRDKGIGVHLYIDILYSSENWHRNKCMHKEKEIMWVKSSQIESFICVTSFA